MLSADMQLNEAALMSILESGHSRIPVHKPGNRCGCSLLSILHGRQSQSQRHRAYTQGVCSHICGAHSSLQPIMIMDLYTSFYDL